MSFQLAFFCLQYVFQQLPLQPLFFLASFPGSSASRSGEPGNEAMFFLASFPGRSRLQFLDRRLYAKTEGEG